MSLQCYCGIIGQVSRIWEYQQCATHFNYFLTAWNCTSLSLVSYFLSLLIRNLCFAVSSFVCKISLRIINRFWWNFWRVLAWPKNEEIRFRWQSALSRILYHQKIGHKLRLCCVYQVAAPFLVLVEVWELAGAASSFGHICRGLGG